MLQTKVRAIVLTLLVAGWMALPAHAETKTIARCGKGFLEDVDSYRVLHIKGTPYEMGYQQGALLKDDINALGPMRSRDVARAQQEIVEAARQLEAQGKLTLKSEGEDEYIV